MLTKETVSYISKHSPSLLKSIVEGTRDGRFHKDNLRQLSRFPDFFVFKSILSAKIWTLVAVGLVFFFKRLIH